MHREDKIGHSAQYFGNYRDHWWNQSFLEALASRLSLYQCANVLDVGCGMCHWSKLLFPFLKAEAEVFAVDNDPIWAKYQEEHIAYFSQKGASFHFDCASADRLPYEDNTFDLVTCQTLLIHVRDPEQVIAEMKRVLKPGGIMLCAEPNNQVQHLIRSSLSATDSIDETIEHIKYALLYEKGKKRYGHGDNSLGDLLPGLLAQLGLENIEVRISDKAIAMYPPYDKQEQLATLRQWAQGGHASPSGTDNRDYFAILGKEYLEFYENYHKKYVNKLDQLLVALEDEVYHAAGGALMYVVSGRKNVN
ncbi:class I SAM-dependent methyltransferase [Catalinimonas niigatensis]|uniref:class I SAM-dependent methyltransferase n=1 Tax=Catalinimonas niigatensis TaxID=1397264 RepID=UPI002666695A|nr:class I SAM-dependent methyltransferase [Catalinimonas niigatensis]WPP51598.1 class I SAM-dependent methyltransferase [Catalinimonas niigatensis]